MSILLYYVLMYKVCPPIEGYLSHPWNSRRPKYNYVRVSVPPTTSTMMIASLTLAT